MRSAILCNVRFLVLFLRRKKILWRSIILYICGSVRDHNWKFTLNNIQCWLQMYATVLSSVIMSRNTSGEDCSRNQEVPVWTKTIPKSQPGWPDPQVTNTINTRINQYHHKDWSNRKDWRQRIIFAAIKMLSTPHFWKTAVRFHDLEFLATDNK